MKRVILEIMIVMIAITVMFVSQNMYVSIIDDWVESDILLTEISYILAALTAGLLMIIAYKTILQGSVDISIKFSKETFIYEAFALLFVANILSIMVMILELLIDNDLITAGNNEISYAGANIVEVLLLIVSAAIVAPILEELLFRGILLKTLSRIMDLKTAVVVSSLVFGVLHRTSLVTILSATWMGIALACIYLFHKNLINSILVHGIYNLIAVCSTLKPDLPAVSSEVTASVHMSMGVLILIGIILYATVGTLIFRGLKNGYREILEKRGQNEKCAISDQSCGL